MDELVNLTGEPIRWVDSGGSYVQEPLAGVYAPTVVGSVRETEQRKYAVGRSCLRLRVHKAVSPASVRHLRHLPDPEPGIIYVTTTDVARVAPHLGRFDVAALSPTFRQPDAAKGAEGVYFYPNCREKPSTMCGQVNDDTFV